MLFDQQSGEICQDDWFKTLLDICALRGFHRSATILTVSQINVGSKGITSKWSTKNMRPCLEVTKSTYWWQDWRLDRIDEVSQTSTKIFLYFSFLCSGSFSLAPNIHMLYIDINSSIMHHRGQSLWHCCLAWRFLSYRREDEWGWPLLLAEVWFQTPAQDTTAIIVVDILSIKED